MPTENGLTEFARRWHCTICNSEHGTWDGAVRCEEGCRKDRVKQAMADKVPVHEIEAALDHEENTDDPIRRAVDAGQPQVSPIACISDRCIVMLNTLQGSDGCALRIHAIKAGQEAVVLLGKLLLLEVTAPSRIDADPVEGMQVTVSPGVAIDKMLGVLPGGKKART